MAPAFAEIVRAARERADVPAVAAGLLCDGRVELAADGDARADTSFRIASITKSFTATAVSLAGLLDDRRRLLLSHTAGCRPESLEPLPRECTGLWSYSNAGYQEAASGFDSAYADALRELVLVPAEERVLAVLTNSWRGSALIRHVVEALDIVPRVAVGGGVEDGRYELDDREATVADGRVVERERDPVTGTSIERRYPVSHDAVLMSWRTDFPRDGVARI